MPPNVYTFNAQGLSTKFVHLTDFIHENYPDIVTITEIWLIEDIPEKVLST